jgi:hypothetical protein
MGVVFLLEGVYEHWAQCNVLGKVGILSMGVMGICGMVLLVCVAIIGLSLGYLIGLKKYLIKKEYRG